jgi:hypothetical protein
MRRCTYLLPAGMIALSGSVGVYAQKPEAAAQEPIEKSANKPVDNLFLASSIPQ